MISRKSRSRASSLFALSIACAPACAPLRLPAKTTGPTTSREGVMVAPDGRALKTMSGRAVDPLALASDQTCTFELRFMTRGGLDCTREMKLEADAGVQMNDRTVEVGQISFLPSRAL